MKSRKILSFILTAFFIMVLVAMTTKLGTPDNVAVQALWAIAAAGLFTIGGQSLVDAVTKIAPALASRFQKKTEE